MLAPALRSLQQAHPLLSYELHTGNMDDQSHAQQLYSRCSVVMPRHNRLDICRLAVAVLPAMARSMGKPETVGSISVYSLALPGLAVMYTPSVYHQLPNQLRARSVLDVWPDRNKGSRKVLSVAWDPMELIAFRPGPWIDALQVLGPQTTLH